MGTLTNNQQKLAKEIRRLCVKTHGKEHVLGWEIVLFRACLGQAKLSTVDFSDMANLLCLSRVCGGWVLSSPDGDKFVPYEEWTRVMRTLESK